MFSEPNSPTFLKDLPERKKALDPTKSFIVQAPAGSGKTTLLVERYLTLLATANSPEEILAITFTRKAAAEMRERVLAALEQAKINDTNQIAKAALKRDKEKNWQLDKYSKRLNISTIDALCQKILSGAPLAAYLAGQKNILEDASTKLLYQNTVRTVFEKALNPKDQNYSALKFLLLHLDNDTERLENLCVFMLRSREQWLPHIANLNNDPNLRLAIEKGWQNLGQETLSKCQKYFPKQYFPEICLLANHAAANIEANSPYAACRALISLEQKLPEADIKTWQTLAQFLLTKEFTWRASIDSRNGFPAPSQTTNQTEKTLRQDRKKRMQELLIALAAHENWRESLATAARLPDLQYKDDEWQIIAAFAQLLKHLVAELKVLFYLENASDYAEIAMEADRVLGSSEDVTATALNLDQKLKHILVDEFQDTSETQYQLIKKLTEGWENTDGRTLFLVGDPMQSIYRFRKAEVGLFLRAKQDGIGNIKLESITLSSNFRSLPHIVDWINKTFTQIFPKVANINDGAVPFIASIAASNSTLQIPNSLKFFLEGEIPTAGTSAAAVLQKIQIEFPLDNIAILVRSRSDLEELLPLLQKENIAYQGVKISLLRQSSAVQDLLALTRALYSLLDRVAWLAILRAPFCGLNLKDLHIIANAKHLTIWENILSYLELDLSLDGNSRLSKFIPIMTKSLERRERQNWRSLIENIWMELEGPKYLTEKEWDEKHVDLFFELLGQENPLNLSLLQDRTESLYLKPPKDPGEAKIQIMTIHSAKGLEFDHVLLFGLENTGGKDSNQALLWQEYLWENEKSSSNSDLLIATIKAHGEEENSKYKYLKDWENRKNQNETARLFYVATTRAKKSLHLFATLEESNKEILDSGDFSKIKCKKGSFLDLLKF